MALDGGEDDAETLLLRVAGDGYSDDGDALDAAYEAELARAWRRSTGKAQASRRKFSLLRMRRADVACLAMVALCACIVTVRQPALRQDNPLWHPVETRTDRKDSLQILTYEDIGADECSEGYTVEYKDRRFKVGGRSTLLLSRDVEYASTPVDSWDRAVLEARRDGLNLVALGALA